MQLKKLNLTAVVRGALILMFTMAPYSIFGQSDLGELRVAIRDKVSGETVPALICITSLADNTWRIPPDGRFPAPYVTNKSFIAGRLKEIEYIAGDKKKWFPGDPGPAVLTTGDFGKEDHKPWFEGRRPNFFYHSREDVPERVDRAFVADSVRTALRLIADVDARSEMPFPREIPAGQRRETEKLMRQLYGIEA